MRQPSALTQYLTQLSGKLLPSTLIAKTELARTELARTELARTELVKAQLPSLWRKLPWLVTLFAVWGLAQAPVAPPYIGEQTGKNIGKLGGLGTAEKRNATGGDLRATTPRTSRESPAPQPYPDLPPAPVHSATAQATYYAVAQARASMGARARAGRGRPAVSGWPFTVMSAR